MKEIAKIQNNLFSFNHRIYDNAKDKEFAMHSHNLYELIYVFSGEVEYVIENKKYNIKPDTLILIKPYSYHYFTITSSHDYEKISILIAPDSLEMGIIINQINDIITHPSAIIKDVFLKLSFYYKNFSLQIFNDMFKPLVKEIFYNLSLYENDNPAQYHNLPEYVVKAIDYINKNLFTIKDLDEIANSLFISKTYLIALFDKYLKIAPKQYIIEKRLLHAKNMISMGMRPTIVYEKCGFSTYTSFFRSYKKYFNVAPSET